MNMPSDYSENIIVIRNIGDLTLVPREKFISTTKHILIACDYNLIAIIIEKMCREERIYSILSLDHSKRLENLSNKVDTVPIFFVSSNEECFDIVNTLGRFPFKGIMKSLNYEDVAIRYVIGHPS